MTISEFKAWLEGFEAAMNGAPTDEQWEAIKAKIAQLRVVNTPWPTYKPRDSGPWWICPSDEDNKTVPLKAYY